MPKKKPPKKVTCQCGKVLTVDSVRTWCDKCGQAVYYDAKNQRRHKFNTIYIGALIIIVFAFLTYIFIELIATPLV